MDLQLPILFSTALVNTWSSCRHSGGIRHDRQRKRYARTYRITEKAARYERVGEIRGAAVAALAVEGGPSQDEVKDIFKKIEKDSDRNYWMTSEEAKEYGMIDEILVRDNNKSSKK